MKCEIKLTFKYQVQKLFLENYECHKNILHNIKKSLRILFGDEGFALELKFHFSFSQF